MRRYPGLFTSQCFPDDFGGRVSGKGRSKEVRG